MVKKKRNYQVKKYPKARQMTSDLFSQAVLHPAVHGLFQIDVTDIRLFFKEIEEKTGDKLSFTAYLVYCLGKAMEDNKMLNSMRKGNRKIIIFDDIDISVMIEIEKNWKKIPIMHVVKKVDKKSFKEINTEIQELKESKSQSYSKQNKLINLYMRLPRFIRELIIKNRYKRDPFFRKNISGTATLSSVGMFSEGGWGIPISMVTVFVLIGGISKKPIVIKDEIKIREILDITFTIDHSIIDGAPAARLTAKMKQLVESKAGLENYM